MKTRSIITLLCFISICTFSNCQFGLTYIGNRLFPIGESAELDCEFDLVGLESDRVEAGWSKYNDDGIVKIGKSQLGENNTFVYDSAPVELREPEERFSMQSEYLEVGQSRATIDNVQVVDAGQYSCDIEAANRQQQSINFNIKVYKDPVVTIELLTPALDIRPQPEAAESIDYGTSSNSTEEYNYDYYAGDEDNDGELLNEDNNENMLSPIVVDPYTKVKIARCVINQTYPEPNVVSFQARLLDGSSPTLSGEIEETTVNADGTFNVVAKLEIEAEARFDGTIFACTAYITDDDRQVSSDFADPISVLHLASYTRIVIFPSSTVNEGDRVTISCVSDGNPAPSKSLVSEDETIDVSEDPYTFTASRSMASLYACTVTNEGSDSEIEDEMVLVVNWMKSPKIMAPLEVRENEPFIATCEARSNVPVTYKWYKDGASIGSSGTLNLGQVDATAAGTYECAATGVGVKTAQHTLAVLIGCQPTVTKYIASSKIEPGLSHVTLTCTAEGSPGCQMDLTSYKTFQPEIEDNKAVLTIPALEKQMNALRFTCTASNEISTNHVTVSLDHEDTCCYQPSAGGLNGGVVVLIIVIVGFIVIGLPLAFCLLRRPRSSGKRKSSDDFEAAKLNAPGREAELD